MILVLTRGSQSVFLRHLEFFRSVMFLTNNRVKTIDPAFDGRIHLTIKYPAPSFESRLPIWKTFLQSRGALSVGDGHNVISDLIEADFNELADLDRHLPRREKRAVAVMLACRPWVFSMFDGLKRR